MSCNSKIIKDDKKKTEKYRFPILAEVNQSLKEIEKKHPLLISNATTLGAAALIFKR